MKCINTAHFDDGEEVIANVFIHAGKDVEKLCTTVALSFMTWIFKKFCYIAQYLRLLQSMRLCLLQWAQVQNAEASCSCEQQCLIS